MSQPFWKCIQGFASLETGSTYTLTYTVGSESSSSSAFQQTSSFTVGANAGIAAGESGGFNCQISVSYTNEMQVTTSQESSSSTQVTESLQLNLPVSPRILFWQKYIKFNIFRTNGISMSNLVYANKETTMNYKPNN